MRMEARISTLLSIPTHTVHAALELLRDNTGTHIPQCD